MAYVGILYVGSEQQELPLVFDTGSVWSWLPAQTCSQCLDQGMAAYDPDQSLFYRRVSDHVQVVKYGQGLVYGYDSKDRICLASSLKNETVSAHDCLDDFAFLAALSLSGLPEMKSGVAGLAPNGQRGSNKLFI